MQHAYAVRRSTTPSRAQSAPGSAPAATVGNLTVARTHRAAQRSDFLEAERIAGSDRDEPLRDDKPSPCADSGARPVLARTAVGPSVETVQCRLNTIHAKSVAQGLAPIADAPLAVDGIFGDHTHAAVVSFQQQVFPVTPIEWDGIVGPKTWAALDAAVAGERPPNFCPRPGVETNDAFATFGEEDVVPGGDLIPCGPQKSAKPPPFKELIVTVTGPVKAEATMRVNPHLHLGVTQRHDPKGVGAPGAHFAGSVQAGGPGTGGEIFFSQVIRNSQRRIRVGTELHEEKVTDHLDGDLQFGTARMPVGPGDNPPVTAGDPPGSGHNRERPKSRYTIKISDDFELFLMWRPSSTSPSSDWRVYGSAKWAWEGTATGISTDSPLTWLSPIEEFKVCDASRNFATRTTVAKGASGAPQTPSHLGLPVNTPGNVALNFKPAFKDPVAREAGLDDC